MRLVPASVSFLFAKYMCCNPKKSSIKMLFIFVPNPKTADVVLGFYVFGGEVKKTKISYYV